jgi:Protein of unknown function (DUF2842)
LARLKILYGSLLLLGGIALYAVIVTRIGIAFLPHITWIEAPYYLVTGVAWVWPAAYVTRWIQDLPPVKPPFSDD